MDNNGFLKKINMDLKPLVEEYSEIPVYILEDKYNINPKAKNHLNILTQRMIEETGNLKINQIKDDERFVFKIIKLDKYGNLKESMSFPTFKYCDIIKETWETSSLRDYLLNHIFAFTVFKGNRKELFLDKIVLWKMPTDVLEQGVRPVWVSRGELREEETAF